MSTPEREAALAADQRSREAFVAWQVAPPFTAARHDAKKAYFAANEEAQRLWHIAEPGGDPLINQLAKAQQVTDAEEGHDADE